MGTRICHGPTREATPLACIYSQVPLSEESSLTAFSFFDVNKIVDSSVFFRCQFSLMKIENTFVARPLDECDPTPPGSGRGYVLYLDKLIEDPSDLAGLTV